MRRKQTEALGDILGYFFQENPALAERLAETKLINAWSEVLGPMVVRYTTHLQVKNGTLYVRLSSAVLRSELMMCRDQLLRKLNREAGMEVIRDIVLT